MSSTETDALTTPPVLVPIGPPRVMRTVVEIGADAAERSGPRIGTSWPRHRAPATQPEYLPEPYAVIASSSAPKRCPSISRHGAHAFVSLTSLANHSTSPENCASALCRPTCWAADRAPPN